MDLEGKIVDGKIGPMRDNRGGLEEKAEVKKIMGDRVGGLILKDSDITRSNGRS